MTADYIITIHAIRRAVDMHLDDTQIRDLLKLPEIRRWDHTGNHQPGWLYTRGDLAAIVDEPEQGKRIVRTFLPSTRAAWERDAQFPPAPGREHRAL